MAVVAAGVMLMAAGILVMLAEAGPSLQGSTGGVIFIGFIPIAFGSGPDGSLLLVASVLLAAVMVAILALSLRGPRNADS
jgi:uncharacterized membrane protein